MAEAIAGWHQAVAAVEALLGGVRDGLPGGAAAVLGITGAAGSGKSALARKLEARLGALVLSTDDYLPDYDGLPRELWDHPDSSDLGLLAEHLTLLGAGRAVRVPVWSFHAHARVGERAVGPVEARGRGAVVIVEGIHALAERVRPALHAGVFVEAPAEVRLARILAREATGERGWGAEESARFFREHQEPAWRAHGARSRAWAGLVVENG
jgi:uridine kinase